jgi:hypothetical protein
MKRIASMSPRARHRLLGVLAIVHSVLIVVFMLARPWPVPPAWFDPLWLGFATLWFFWPIVLVLHRGRSFWPVVLPLLIAGIVAIPWWRIYSTQAADMFGLPMGCSLSPISMSRFVVSYIRGRADARRDIHDGHVAVEVYGFGAGGVTKPLLERYQVETHVVAGCVVDDQIMGHAYGYNTISAAEAKRRTGVDILRSDSGQPNFDLLFDEHGNPK